MSVTVDGIFSGLDTTALINAIIGVQAGKRNTMQSQLERRQTSLRGVTDLNATLKKLSEAASTLRTAASDGYKATVPESAGFSADAGAGAVPGTYSVAVTALATSEMEVSQGFASDVAGVLSTGSMDITIGGVTTTVTVDGTNNNLRDLSRAIDELDGVHAYVLNNGGASPFQLVIQAENTGAASAITIDTAGLGGGTTPVFTEAQTGADAALTVNGLAVSSASNSVNAVPGLTLDLNQAGLGAFTVEVELDREAVEENLRAFVDAYNQVSDFYARNNTFNQESGVGGSLFGDSTARGIIGRLGDLVSSGYATTSSLSILAQVGITTQQTGNLKLDTVVLDDAISADFEDLVDFLTSDTGPLAALAAEIDDVFVDSLDGILKTRKDSIERSIRDLEEQIADEDRRLDDQAKILRGRFTALEATLAELQSASQFIANLFPPTTTKSS